MKWFIFFTLGLFASIANAVVTNDVSLEHIQSNIDQWGVSSVIVEYESLAGLAGSANTLNGLTDGRLKSAVSSMRSNFFLSASPQLSNSIQMEFDYVPSFVATVGNAELEELMQHPLVKNIYPNKPHKSTLAESVDLVYPNKKAVRLDGGDDWTVAIIDTGVDRSHSYFSTNGETRVISEACYSGGTFTRFDEVDSLCPANVVATTFAGSGVHCTGYDGCDHGTHVAGIAAGNDGVASGANIIAIQVFTGLRDIFRRDICDTGAGTNCIVAFDSDIIAGLNRVYALRNIHNIAAVNMSLGSGEFSSNCNNENRVVTDIISLLKTADIATTVSSGNNGFPNAISYPACISDAIAVGATSDFTGFLFGTQFTVDRRTVYSNNSSLLDIYAPGSLIRSSVPGNGFADFNGTSMAAPHVAGAFAILKQGLPEASVNQLETVLESVGPIITFNGVIRRRLSISEVINELDLFKPTIAPVIQLLLEE